MNSFNAFKRKYMFEQETSFVSTASLQQAGMGTIMTFTLTMTFSWTDKKSFISVC